MAVLQKDLRAAQPEGACGLHQLRYKAKEDGYIELGNYVVESPETLVKKAQEYFADKQDPMSEEQTVESVFESIMGLPDQGMRDEINERKKRERRPKNPLTTNLRSSLPKWSSSAGGVTIRSFKSFMFYQRSKGVWRREEYKHEYKHSSKTFSCVSESLFRRLQQHPDQ